MRLAGLFAAFALAAGSCSADELKADWCDFRATVSGKFDVVTDDPEFGISTAHQTFEKYAVSWLCERKSSTPLPKEQPLCSERRASTTEVEGSNFLECFYNHGAAGRYVTAVTLAENPSGHMLTVEGRWVAPQSVFTLILADYGLTDEERLAMFKQLAGACSSWGLNQTETVPPIATSGRKAYPI